MPALAEAFREHGFEGASLAILSKATGLGKGSLYNFFPGGKEEMLAAVMADIDAWFAKAVFSPLEQATDSSAAVTAMIEEVTTYFRSGGRVCLVGVVGLGSARDRFAGRVKDYFVQWVDALTHCLAGGGVSAPLAQQLAEDTVGGIQGAIVLSRALDEADAFARIVRRHEDRLLDALAGPADTGSGRRASRPTRTA